MTAASDLPSGESAYPVKFTFALYPRDVLPVMALRVPQLIEDLVTPRVARVVVDNLSISPYGPGTGG